jgi:hypothetical protein
MATTAQILAMAGLAKEAGWSDNSANDRMTAVALSITVNPASDPTLVNGTRYGLWQLFASDIPGPDPTVALTAAKNAEIAFTLWQHNGWSHWPEFDGAAFKTVVAQVAQIRLSFAWRVAGATGGPNPLDWFVKLYRSTAGIAQQGVNTVAGAGGMLTGFFSNLQGAVEGAIGLILGLVLIILGVWLLSPRRGPRPI